MRNYFNRFGRFSVNESKKDKLNSVFFGLCAWIVLALGLQYFVIDKAINKKDAFYKGLLYGLFVYGVYDFTNMATIKNWTIEFLVQDIIWGMLLCGTIAYLRR